ncbi:MAG: glycosyltransferase family 4 protein [Candidatus Sungbacteria bacterium]|nr:glycosyltransferase family 4 protein [Candidatus Sungbacteria bacterium]
MRLLIVTQKIDKDDENLGFFHSWVEEFAKHADELTVIAGYVGRHSFPVNVRVVSLQKEKGAGRPRRIWRYIFFFCRYLREADAIFFHMIPEFVLASRHAIDTNIFVSNSKPETLNFKTLRILTVGRISPVKDIETIIRACAFLKNNWDRQWSFSIVGGPLMPRDEEYLRVLKKLVAEGDLARHISFQGARPWSEIPYIYNEHDIFISMSTTGSIDKSVLEAMSSGLTVITANEAFQSLLPPKYFLEKRSPEFLAERIKILADENRPNMGLRDLVIQNHSLGKTIKKIMDAYIKL